MEGRAALLEPVIGVLRRSLGLSEDQRIDAETKLLRAGLTLDSVSLLEFVMALEDAFHCEIEDDEIDPLRFGSVGVVAEFMQSKLAGEGS
ncbi:MAG: acyl carrier protein [Deltaproteobacteria bacterium]|nr:acyl carrier protein [Deltaproteobacteria bacterium]